MKRTLGCAILTVGLCANATHAANAVPDQSISAFNRALSAATRAMDNQASLALWEDDGTSLLPDTSPINGKPAIARFLARVSQQLHGAHMQLFDLACHDVRTAGDWAFEWCDEHQVVTFANGQPPFNGYGRMALVLHRGTDHAWRLSREMWQPTKAP